MKYCESCHTANKDRARYCSGCKGKFSGVRFAANSTESSFAESHEIISMPPVPSSRVDRSGKRRELHSTSRKGLGLFVLLLVAGALAYGYSSLGKSRIDWPKAGDSIRSFGSSVTTSVSSTVTSLLSSVRGLTVSSEVAVVDAPAPVPAPATRRRNVAVPEPVSDGADPKAGCSEALEALALCPK
jgi:hypothetical protein